jgi:ribonuclease HI
MHVTIHTDGGARGNPGPAAAAFVIRDAEKGTILSQAGIYLGTATNNVAEYTAMLRGLAEAAKLGATQVEVVSDSELMVKQMLGKYKVKNEGLQPLFRQALALRDQFEKFAIRHVYREQNAVADDLVNRAIDLKSNVVS